MDSYEFMTQGNPNIKLYKQGDSNDTCAEHGKENCQPCEEGRIYRNKRLAELSAKYENNSGSRVGERSSQRKKNA